MKEKQPIQSKNQILFFIQVTLTMCDQFSWRTDYTLKLCTGRAPLPSSLWTFLIANGGHCKGNTSLQVKGHTLLHHHHQHR